MIRSGVSRSDFVIATRKMHAFMQVHLTTANQSEIRKAYLVSVNNHNIASASITLAASPAKVASNAPVSVYLVFVTFAVI